MSEEIAFEDESVEMTDEVGVIQAAGDVAVEDGGQSAGAAALEIFQLAQQGSANFANHAASSINPNSAKSQATKRDRLSPQFVLAGNGGPYYDNTFKMNIGGRNVDIHQGKLNAVAGRMANHYRTQAQQATGQRREQLLQEAGEWNAIQAATSTDIPPDLDTLDQYLTPDKLADYQKNKDMIKEEFERETPNLDKVGMAETAKADHRELAQDFDFGGIMGDYDEINISPIETGVDMGGHFNVATLGVEVAPLPSLDGIQQVKIDTPQLS